MTGMPADRLRTLHSQSGTTLCEMSTGKSFASPDNRTGGFLHLKEGIHFGFLSQQRNRPHHRYPAVNSMLIIDDARIW
ncbi:hypothetical protein SAMN05216333_1369 [Nitrosomonas oligotropha]|uniref:Uncharacterized protein n=1 Tax=Nitrosomonas oligotropha TaxID=42354 RepID=A0A1H8UIC6_9PROT|nr:hypothetical protein SAMN05216333_1369 [Nitrosomonas oligotropha]